ncbi:sugar translocase [Rhizocola hellebori]|uniref:dolichyl-phosphate beta-glucosyltransferase n=1 Tax=Rhizocola hellebori TaxID=1392758 RepID=A0A8J3VI76_9ACTN|nr:bifunctional glycosyltransferase family 2/GtrA family protein [Rhizocola hellebori]GIH07300.1 sugar translocase [Rhizocola hellebori]
MTPVALDTLVLDVVVPVHNEEKDLEKSVRRLHSHLSTRFPFPYRITIADNASTDGTAAIAAMLAGELSKVRHLRLEQKGRGNALRHSWSTSEAAVLAYLDVDLSTDLAALLPLVAPLISGHSDLAIGSRLSPQARVVRGAKRELISRAYNQLLKRTLAVRFSDAQCGFKAIRADIAKDLLPLVRDTGWFFDTELLVLAQNIGLRIHEVPVDWTDDPDSRVDIVSTAIADLKGVSRVGRALLTGALPVARLREQLGRGPLASVAAPGVQPHLLRQLVRFGAIGIVSTAAYVLLYALARPAMGAQAANLVALLLTAIANTAANRRLTFGIRGRAEALRHQAQGLVVFGLGFAFTSSSLLALHLFDPLAGHLVETLVLVGANLLATLVRFLLLRGWVFAGRTGVA